MASNDSSSTVVKCREVLTELYDCQPGDTDRASEILVRLRVLTREKTLTPDVIDNKCTRTLVDHSMNCQIEAQKCLSNLILNYAHLRRGLVEPYVTCLEKRLTTDEQRRLEDEEPKQQQYREVLYYDLRIIFLLSALCPESRSDIRDRILEPLMKVTLKEADQFSEKNQLLVIESLKTLFNLTMDKCLDTEIASELVKKLFSIVGTDRDTTSTKDEESKLDHTDLLLVNLIHLLTNMPAEVYHKLSDEDVDKVLHHLDEQLRSLSKNSLRDTALPVLNTCANICRYKDDVQRRWFKEIIESTTDFEKRPEEYDTLRGRLVKLMTSVDIHIKDIAAEFLHALCGGDTEKFITYTGFGNSAAFLASKGLLTQSTGKSLASADQSHYGETQSSDYQELQGRLNPITGRFERPKRDPMEGMSEEEKEWHAHELASAIAKLSGLGVIKPMQIGSDNRITELEPQEQNNPPSTTSDHSS